VDTLAFRLIGKGKRLDGATLEILGTSITPNNDVCVEFRVLSAPGISAESIALYYSRWEKNASVISIFETRHDTLARYLANSGVLERTINHMEGCM
jgi:hypothetical protein